MHKHGKDPEAVDEPLLLLIMCSQHGWDRLCLRLPCGIGMYMKLKLRELSKCCREQGQQPMMVRPAVSDASMKNKPQAPEDRTINWNRFTIQATTDMQWPPLPDAWIGKLQKFVSNGINIMDAQAISPHAGRICLTAKVSFIADPRGKSMNRTEAIVFLRRALHMHEATQRELEEHWSKVGVPTKLQRDKITSWENRVRLQKKLPIADDEYFRSWLQSCLKRSDIEHVFARKVQNHESKRTRHK